MPRCGPRRNGGETKFAWKRILPTRPLLMTWAEVAVSAAGGTVGKLAFLGVPMILIARRSDQECNASAISEQGAARA